MYLEINQINFSYNNGETMVLKDFSMNTQKGEIVAIVGSSGSGKSSLLRIISGLEDRSNGIIKLDDKIIQDKTTFIEPEKRSIGFVFQDYALYPFLTVWQNIEFGIKKMPLNQRKKRISEMLALVRISDLAARYPHELSGGQMQRVALARSLAPAPRLLLMDEPFSNLDASLVLDLRNELKALLKHENMTVILVTHNHEDATFMSDRIIEIHS